MKNLLIWKLRLVFDWLRVKFINWSELTWKHNFESKFILIRRLLSWKHILKSLKLRNIDDLETPIHLET